MVPSFDGAPRVRRRCLCVLALSLGLLASFGVRANQDQQPVFRTSATMVTVDAVVVDKDGRHVLDLTASDFEVLQSGKVQSLQHAVYVPLSGRGHGTGSRVAASEERANPAGGAPDIRQTAAGPLTVGEALRARAAPAGRTVAVVVDDLGMSFESTVAARAALRKFVDEQVQPDDLVAILRTAGGVGALQQFTTDRRILHAAVDRVRWTVISRSGVAAFAPVSPPAGLDPEPVDPSRQDISERAIGGQHAELGSPYGEDSEENLRGNALTGGSLGALEFVVRGVEQLPGRKAVLFISEGFDLFNRKGQAKVFNAFVRLMDRANRAGVVVYTMDARGLETGRLTAEDHPMPPPPLSGVPGNDGDRAMRDLLMGHDARRQAIIRNTEEALHYLAWQTGGFALLNSNDLLGGMRRVLDDLRGYYLLGYEAPAGTPRNWDPGRVIVRVTRPGLRVRSRQGFFGPADPALEKDTVGDPLMMAALSPFSAGDLAVRLTALFGHDMATGNYVRSLLFIDAADVQFAAGAEGRHEASLDIIQLAVGDNGMVLGDWSRTLTLSLTDDQLRDARARGIVYSTRMTVKKPGAYQVRVGVRDTRSAALGSASHFLEIPEVGGGRLAVSGVLVRDAGTSAADARSAATGEDAAGGARETLGEPSLRIFQRGTDVVYAYEIYDGLDADNAAHLEMSTSLLRDGRVLYESPWSAVRARPRTGDTRVIPIAGRLSLGADVPHGPYTLQVSVSQNENGRRRMRADGWVDLEVQ